MANAPRKQASLSNPRGSSIHRVHPRHAAESEPLRPPHREDKLGRDKLGGLLTPLLGAPWDEAKFLNRDLEHERAFAELYRRYAGRFRIRGVETGMLKLAQLAERQVEALEDHLRLGGVEPSGRTQQIELRPNPLEILGQLWELEKDQAQTYREQLNGCEAGATRRLLDAMQQTKRRQTREMQRVLAYF